MDELDVRVLHDQLAAQAHDYRGYSITEAKRLVAGVASRLDIVRGADDLDVHAAVAQFPELPTHLQFEMVSMLNWHVLGYPMLVPDQRVSYALMATPVESTELLQETLRTAPRSWVIPVNGLGLSVKDPKGGTIGGSFITVYYSAHQDSLLVRLSSESGLGIWMHVLLKDIGVIKLDELESEQTWWNGLLEGEDERNLELSLRLAVGCILAHHHPDRDGLQSLRVAQNSYRVVSKKSLEHFGDLVREYLRRGGSSPRIRFLVRGHWRHQRHGAALSLVKLIWIAPHMKGPTAGLGCEEESTADRRGDQAGAATADPGGASDSGGSSRRAGVSSEGTGGSTTMG